MLQYNRILAVVPARGGSKGVPRKNLRQIAGKSLLGHTIGVAKLSKFIDEIIISSEDAEIIKEAKSHGAHVPFIRPDELAQDDSPGIDPILHAIENVPGYDYVLVLQTTSPFRSVEDIDGCIQSCFEKNAPSCVSLSEAKKSPHWMYSLTPESKLDPFVKNEILSRRQDLPPTYVLNGAIFFANIPWLLENKSFYSDETIGYVMPAERGIDIDTEMDLSFANFYLRNLPIDI